MADIEDDFLPDEPPHQECPHRWEYERRKDPKWGTVTKEGLKVGRGDRQRIVPPDEVFKLGALGCTDTEIATWFGIDQQTLRYNFKEYLAKAREDIKIRLRQAMFKNALGGHAVMQIFLAKNLLGMSDNPAHTESQEPLPWSDAEDK